jgi:ADP-ribose pyrophosphatase YjhB (NUDIX family)
VASHYPRSHGNWALPGSAIDLGELVAQAAVRETLEETGMQLFGKYRTPNSAGVRLLG